MLSACSTWPMLCCSCLYGAARCWCIYFGHLTRCLASQFYYYYNFFHFIFFSPRTFIFNWKIFGSVLAYCTHTRAHIPKHTHRHKQFVFYSSVIWCVCVGRSCNYFILVFQFRNDNNNLPAAKPKIKFTPIQNKMEFALCALFVFPKLQYAMRLFAVLFHCLFVC